MANDITTEEYQKYQQLREQIIKGMEEADSEFMLTTYSMLHSVMNKRYKAAMQVNLRIENKAVREKKEAKRGYSKITAKIGLKTNCYIRYSQKALLEQLR